MRTDIDNNAIIYIKLNILPFRRMFSLHSIMRANPSAANAEGGNRTLIPGGNTILSRARLPIPPLRLLGSLAPCAPKYTTPKMKVK